MSQWVDEIIILICFYEWMEEILLLVDKEGSSANLFFHLFLVWQIIEQCEKRLGESVEELVELVAEVFPTPAQTEPDEAAGEDNEEIPDGQQMDASWLNIALVEPETDYIRPRSEVVSRNKLMKFNSSLSKSILITVLMIKSFAVNRLYSYLDDIYVSVWPSSIHIDIRTPFKYCVPDVVSSSPMEPLEIFPTLNLGFTGL